MVDVKKILNDVKEKLAKLKDVKGDIVEEVYKELNDYLSSVKFEDVVEAKPEVEEKKEDVKEDVEVKEKSDTKDEVKDDAEVKEDIEKTEEVKENTEKTEDVKKDVEVKEDVKGAELSKDVVAKLKDAAVELTAKQEIIDGFKGKVVELEKELQIYKDREAVELKKRYDVKALNLIELYAKLGIKKDYAEIELNFSEEQVDKLSKDLELAKTNIVNKEIRQTSITPGLELSKKDVKSDMLDARKRAQLLLNI